MDGDLYLNVSTELDFDLICLRARGFEICSADFVTHRSRLYQSCKGGGDCRENARSVEFIFSSM